MYKYFFKRFIDVLLSLIALLAVTPFLIPICIGLLLTGEHYIFYFQRRMGYRNKIFEIWKFATMLKASPSLGTGSITLKNDWRLTPMGKFLRITKINEIPQLINILKGDMSIIGPRPIMEYDFNKLSEDLQSKLYKSRPGLTGIASIIFRDEEELFSQIDMDLHEFERRYLLPYKVKLEVWYQNNLSFKSDIILILLTGWTIIFPKSELVFKIFKDLPERPEELRKDFTTARLNDIATARGGVGEQRSAVGDR